MWFLEHSFLFATLLFLGTAIAAPAPLLERADISILSTEQVGLCSALSSRPNKILSGRLLRPVQSSRGYRLLFSFCHVVLEL